MTITQLTGTTVTGATVSADITADVAGRAPEFAGFDLYRDVHKGIRAELFRVTVLAGTTDPSDRTAREMLRAAVVDLVDNLVHHAEHEDRAIQPSIERHLPALAARIVADHEALEARMVQLVALADSAVGASEAERRIAVQRLYAELAPSRAPTWHTRTTRTG
jgi:Hemerythrin HHE cation binding domain